MALAVSALSVGNSAAGLMQRFRFGRAIRGSRIDPPPLFIVGHWRTGTTMLHELLALDPQFRCPTTYECMAPGHFLVTGDLVGRHLRPLLPGHRPLDAMRLGADLPQEDEFAICNLGARSAYHAWAFPRRAAAWEEGLDPHDFAAADREQWQRALTGFLRALTIPGPGRLVLKSPPHTARVGLLAEMFPGAGFIHLVRDPRQMVPSFQVAWRRMAGAVGLQSRCREDLDDWLVGFGARLYRRFDADRAALGHGRMADVSYEDLAADPAGELARLYGYLGLPHPERVPAVVAAYHTQVGAYTPAIHHPSPGLRRAISAHWGAYAARYGYRMAGPPA